MYRAYHLSSITAVNEIKRASRVSLFWKLICSANYKQLNGKTFMGKTTMKKLTISSSFSCKPISTRLETWTNFWIIYMAGRHGLRQLCKERTKVHKKSIKNFRRVCRPPNWLMWKLNIDAQLTPVLFWSATYIQVWINLERLCARILSWNPKLQ